MPKIERPPKATFYRLLWFRFLPIWVAWQGLWFLAFEYFIDYSRHPITSLVTTKLALESVFYAVVIVKLGLLSKLLSISKVVILAMLIVLLLFTLQRCFVGF